MPELNFDVEPLVREVFGSAVKRDVARHQRAIAAIAARGDQASQDAFNLACAISTAAVYDIHDGGRPDNEQLTGMARSFVDMNPWAGFEVDDVLKVLTALTGFQSLPPDFAPTAARVVYVLGAWLLGAFGPMERRWWIYMDEILNVLEAGRP